jgi:simple sugar transport system ATP-binding protein
MMVGRTVSLNIDRPEPKNPVERLIVKNLTVIDAEGVRRLDDVSFTACGGEILGIAGISGSGQRELLESLAGLGCSKRRVYPLPPPRPEEELVGKTPGIYKLGVHLAFVRRTASAWGW